jgi:diguanylate cyclase (GGDEF)-like protein
MYDYTLLISSSAVIGIIVLLYILVSHKMKIQQDAAAEREITQKENQIRKLNTKINSLTHLNSRYLSFILKVPAISHRLHSAVNLQEITDAITELANDIITTDRVEIYLLDGTDNRLKKMTSGKDVPEEQISYALGEDIVGIAAEHRFVMMREHYSKIYHRRQENDGIKPQLSIAVPIVFKERLLGVIGIGEIDNPVGSESDLLRMIADISSAALINQILLNEVRHEANTDALTGLSNRNYLNQMAEIYREKALREGTGISVVLFDIDNFKNYNDTNGHKAGDSLLIELSRLMQSDTRKEATVARFGGEEFIVMLPGISKRDAFSYADQLRKKISQHSFPYREKQPLGFVSISGGIACFPEDGDSMDTVIQNADKSLYRAKSEGKNRILLHTG